eukprot:GILI01014094.1.p1 GENE.GILI01014094.1~~GILI01014094.1.p1  ORF type:complete len:421 (+),score=107.58 GILI01014094.1:139-1263(+)
MATALGVEWREVSRWEKKLAQALFEAWTAQVSSRKHTSKSRWVKIGLAALGGGALLAVTGGLAAPALTAAIGGTLGFSMASYLGTATGTAAMSYLFGATGAGYTGYKMHKRVSEVKDFQMELIRGGRGLNLIICVSGWVNKESDFTLPWHPLRRTFPHADLYALKFERQHMFNLGSMLQDTFTKSMRSTFMKEWLKHTVLAPLMTALAWPTAALQAANYIDSVWAMAADRCHKAGQILAEVIADRTANGNRPVTLIGYSMGARTIFTCLQTLAERGLEGCVENAVLLGAAITVSEAEWSKAKRAVAGRFINGYTKSDWVLAFLYRYNEWAVSVAGLKPVNAPGIENVDLSTLIRGHNDYRRKTPDIMLYLGLEF